MSNKEVFIKESKRVAFDLNHRKTIRFNISKYDAAVAVGKQRYSDLDLAKEKAAEIKSHVITHLDEYLEIFEKNAKRNGIEVLWAKDANETLKHISEIVHQHEAKLVVKSKSMTTEEVELNEHLEKENVESVETDLGEYIVQIAGEKPYHIVTPAMHKSKEDIATLFHEKHGTPEHSSPEFLTNFVRETLREKFCNADVGVTGANFIVADAGGIALTENEGNGVMTMAFPKTHVVIAGIEKVIPSYRDLAHFWPLLAAHGTGQQITVYNSLITGPKKSDEVDGPERMVVILMDNGRTDLLESDKQFEALKCIRCGACLNSCPIYKNIGGYTYDATYSGPIGSVITPFYKGFKDYNHLSFACSVCGKCSEVCPVKIPLHDLLLLNRSKAVEEGNSPLSWTLAMKGMELIMGKRALMDLSGGGMKNLGLQMVPHIAGEDKSLPPIAKESFSKQWKRNRNKNKS
ncbi:iron-sulfur cluster-binding protein [Prolixibacteraceae bacterium JC049]|nr:iron-sulfur cluster-binding protein [Prolixibacteraceae bacterium JC049]